MPNARFNRLNELLNRVNSALASGDHPTAVDLLHQAAEGFILRKEYGKAYELFEQLFSLLAEMGLLDKIFFYARNASTQFERGEAFLDGGNLLRHVADLALENHQYRTAAEFYGLAGDFLQRSGKENSQLAAACFAKAAEGYGVEKKTNKAERFFLRAVMSALNIEQELLQVAEKGWRALGKNHYKSASEHFRSVSSAFNRGVPELAKLSSQLEIKALSANATARLYHLSAMFALLAALCFVKFDRMDQAEEEFEIVRYAAKKAIETTKPILERNLADSEDKWRSNVDLLLLVIANYFVGVPWEDASLLDEMKRYDETNETILFAAEKISRGQLTQSFEYLEAAELGRLDEAKNLIIETIQSKKVIS
ncbi:MAG: hypothetical protein ACE5R6_14325 [Candidatus Heimdallarchaeota archaeon]